jgi:hypothetical protein
MFGVLRVKLFHIYRWVRIFASPYRITRILDADVKEYIVQDPALLSALVNLGKVAGSLVYTLACIYVNLTNSYKKPEGRN